MSPQRAEPAAEPAARLLRLQAAAGNRAVSRMIAARRRVLARRPVAMTQPGYATGDQFAIAAALIDDRELHVYISTVPPGRDARDKAADIRQFYLDSGVADARIHLVATEQLNDYDALTAAARARRPDFFRIFGVGHGTDYVAKRFSAGMRDRIRAAWGVDDSRDAEIRTWLSGKGLATPAADARAGTRVLVIWSRFSGKKGDIHIEHDTSFQGVRQIIDMAKDDYTAIIIAGDKSWGDRHVAKYGQIAKAVNDTLAAPKVFDLTGFWKDGTPELQAWGGDARLGQLKLYDYLQRHFGEVKHLGFRSGNLEALAMLGYQVRYMEEPGSEGAERMAKWHGRDATGRTALGGLATGYERLQVSGPPTRSGQYALSIHQRRPGWAPGKPGASPKPRAIREDTEHYGRGFYTSDLDVIAGYLGV